MSNTLVHRGPDGQGVFIDGPVGLGMRRLAIIDLEGGGQPIGNQTGRIQVIQNGEIYNYRELRTELEGQGHRFQTQSDTEVIVYAYQEWGGLEFAKHLRGMFAVAVWDGDRRELWLARDRVGIKPLYYARTPTGFAFASEVKALLASGIVPREIEPKALAQYLSYGSAGIEDSFVRNVRQLRPGHVLLHKPDRCVTHPYWAFNFSRRPRDIGEKEACELLREHLQEAVRTHLVSDVPVGVFLSGGIDSSAIVGLMAEEGMRGFKTFSIGFEEQPYNELPYARQVAEKWGTEHYEEVIRPDAVAILESLCYYLDEPFADASALPTWYVSQLAAREVKVVLSGDGGDELFAGYERYLIADQRTYLDKIPYSLRRLGASVSQILPDAFPGKYFLDYSAHDLRGRYIYDCDLFPPPLRSRLLRPEWSPQTLDHKDPSMERRQIMENSQAPDPMSERMHLDLCHYLPLDILTKVDRTSMAHSLEVRPPLLDHQLIEFTALLPLSLKFTSDRRRKYIFKQAIRTLLPDSLLNRPKAGFSVPLQSWFTGPLRPMFEELVLSNGRCLEYLNPTVIRLLLRQNSCGRRNHGLKLWALLILEKWLRGDLAR